MTSMVEPGATSGASNQGGYDIDCKEVTVAGVDDGSCLRAEGQMVVTTAIRKEILVQKIWPPWNHMKFIGLGIELKLNVFVELNSTLTCNTITSNMATS